MAKKKRAVKQKVKGGRPNLRGTKWKALGSGAFKFLKVGQILQGWYLGERIVKVENREQRMHSIQDEAGNKVEFWESTVLECLRGLRKNTPVHICFLGLAGKGKQKYRNFDVKVPEGANLQPEGVPF